MSKTFRRLLLSSLFLLLASFIFLGQNKVRAVTTTEINGSSYYVGSRKETNQLQYGVLQYTDISYLKAGRNPQGGSNCTSAAAGSGGGGGCNLDDYYPQQVNVLEVPSSTDIRIVPWSKMSQANWNLAKVKDMAANYELLNPGYSVIAAINGDFFDINSNNLFPKTPSNAHVSNGEYYKSSGGRIVSFTNNATTETLIGNSAATRTATPILAIYDETGNITKQYTINKVNAAPSDGQIAVYYANWALEPGWAAQKIVPITVNDAIIVKGGKYALPISKTDFYGLGTITSIGSAELSSGDFAIVSKNTEVTSLLAKGVKIRVQYEFTGKYAGATDVIGVGDTLIYNGLYANSTDTNRHPRTMVGVKPDGTIVMTVVDGRQPEKGMYGATASEMAAVLKHYGCKDGYNLDGGGSSTMIILDQGEFRVLNSPSDGIERSDSNCLLVVAKVPTITYSAAVEPNKIVISADLVDKKGIAFTDLYVELDNVKKKVENGKATFTNLNPNTPYSYKFYGYLDGVYRDLVVEGKTATSKRLPLLTKINLEKDGTDLYVYVNFNDPDNAIIRRSVQIGNRNVIITKGKAVFEQFSGSALSDLAINLSYDLNDGGGRVDLVMTNQPLSCPISLILDSISYELNEFLKSLLAN